MTGITRLIPVTAAALLGAALAVPLAGSSAQAAAGLPQPDHIVVVIEENHSYNEIIGSSSASYINSLAGQGALFTQSFAVTHPSEPNYLELFSGSTQGVTDDSCPHTFGSANLGAEAIGAGLTFKGYSEAMPSDGYTGCTSGSYARKHNPWVNFTNVPASDNLTFAGFPSDFTTLPTISFVVPNLINDMHDGSVAQGDTWLHSNIDPYAQWAKSHNSLLIVTWDEDDSSQSNHIPTFFVGANVKAGTYSEHITHDTVLRTIEDAENLPYAGNSASVSPITDAFSANGSNVVTVTNPGTQTSTVGVAASLQIQASDSASGQTLTYGAAGLPAGLAINSSTGLISGTPSVVGTSSVTVTATDGTNASGSTTFTWVVTSGSGCTASAWNASTTYRKGAVVSYSSHQWTATRRSTGVTPGTNGVWTDNGPC